MISETHLLDCENLPPEMAATFDRSWHFVGEVRADVIYMEAICKGCLQVSQRAREVGLLDPAYWQRPIIKNQVRTVTMQRYLFFTDDMIEVYLYFGTCAECDGVYWARQGPPFNRARCLVTA